MFLLISLLANGTNGGDHRTPTVSRFGSTNGALSAYSGINGAINWSIYAKVIIGKMFIYKTFLHIKTHLLSVFCLFYFFCFAHIMIVI